MKVGSGNVVDVEVAYLIDEVDGLFFFSSRRRHTRYWRDWSSDVCSSDLAHLARQLAFQHDVALVLASVSVRRDHHPRGEAPLLDRERSAGAIRRDLVDDVQRSEERRVGKERRSRWSPYH